MINDSERELIDFLRTEINSIRLYIFKQQQLASLFEFSICKGIPSDAIQTACHHIFCRNSLDSWMHLQSACPFCRQPMDKNDIVRLYGASLFLYKSLLVKCKNSPKDCKFERYLEKYIIHKIIGVHQGKSVVRGQGMKKVSNHQSHDCLLNRLFRRRSKKTSNEFPVQIAIMRKMFPFDDVVVDMWLYMQKKRVDKLPWPNHKTYPRTHSKPMMTSSNGNIFRVIGHFEHSPHKGQWRGALMFSLSCAWINS